MTLTMVVAGCYIGPGDIAAVEDLESSDVEVEESLAAFAVEACQAFRTRCSKPYNLDHNYIDPVVVSMSEIVQIDHWQGKDQGGLEQHSYPSAGADSVLNAAV